MKRKILNAGAFLGALFCLTVAADDTAPYFDPEFPGAGLLIFETRAGVSVFWFTHADEHRQQWFIAGTVESIEDPLVLFRPAGSGLVPLSFDLGDPVGSASLYRQDTTECELDREATELLFGEEASPCVEFIFEYSFAQGVSECAGFPPLPDGCVGSFNLVRTDPPKD